MQVVQVDGLQVRRTPQLLHHGCTLLENICPFSHEGRRENF